MKMRCKRIARHINRWNQWRKFNLNGKLHKLLVLIGVMHSPTFESFLDKKQLFDIQKAFGDCINRMED